MIFIITTKSTVPAIIDGPFIGEDLCCCKLVQKIDQGSQLIDPFSRKENGINEQDAISVITNEEADKEREKTEQDIDEVMGLLLEN